MVVARFNKTEVDCEDTHVFCHHLFSAVSLSSLGLFLP